MRLRRKEVSVGEKARVASAICERILSDDRITASLNNGALAVYFASPDEIDLADAIVGMLARGVKVVAPRWNGTGYELARLEGVGEGMLRRGPMGILEPALANPVSPEDVAVWLAPGLAFTRGGGRIGYGGGWYDRLMAGARTAALKLGIAYDFQLIESIPSEPHDIRLDAVIVAD